MKEQHDDKKYIVLAVLVSFEKDIRNKKYLWIWKVNMNLYIIIYRKKDGIISWYVSDSLTNISLHFNTTQEETKHFQRGIINQ